MLFHVAETIFLNIIQIDKLKKKLIPRPLLMKPKVLQLPVLSLTKATDCHELV